MRYTIGMIQKPALFNAYFNPHFMVLVERLELSRYWRQNLNLVRLPIPPYQHIDYAFLILSEEQRTFKNTSHAWGILYVSELSPSFLRIRRANTVYSLLSSSVSASSLTSATLSKSPLQNNHIGSSFAEIRPLLSTCAVNTVSTFSFTNRL